VSGAAVEKSSIPEDPEDRKIITLARSAAVRTGAEQGACVRDSDGRTYAGTSVHMAHLDLSAVSVTVAMAASSGAGRLEAAAVAGAAPTQADLDVLRDLAQTIAAVWHVDLQGEVISVTEL
jgi:hypothetical protein